MLFGFFHIVKEERQSFMRKKTIFQDIAAKFPKLRSKLADRKGQKWTGMVNSAILDEHFWNFFLEKDPHHGPPSVYQIWANFMKPIKRY